MTNLGMRDGSMVVNQNITINMKDITRSEKLAEVRGSAKAGEPAEAPAITPSPPVR